VSGLINAGSLSVPAQWQRDYHEYV